MQNTRHDVGRNGNQGGSGQAGPQPVTSREGLGHPVADVEGLREGATPAAGACHDQAAGAYRRGDVNDSAGAPYPPQVVASSADSSHDNVIIYRGQEVQATLVNYIDGDHTTSTAKDHYGLEQLLRDSAGNYYLRQRVDATATHPRSITLNPTRSFLAPSQSLPCQSAFVPHRRSYPGGGSAPGNPYVRSSTLSCCPSSPPRR